MPRKLKVGVIFAGRSAEHEVSLVSATSIINAPDKNKKNKFHQHLTEQSDMLHTLKAKGELVGIAELEKGNDEMVKQLFEI